jgi:hypothetical protein
MAAQGHCRVSALRLAGRVTQLVLAGVFTSIGVE